LLVYMAPCGIGLGHAARTLAIAKELVKRGHEVVFSTYGEAVEYLRKEGFKVLKAPQVEYKQRDDGTIDLKLTLSRGPSILYRFMRQVGAEIYYTGQYKPDIVVSDTRLSAVMASAFRLIPRILIINQLLIVIPKLKPPRRQFVMKVKGMFERLSLEILSRLWNLSDLIMIPDFPPPLTISKNNLLIKDEYADKSIFIGPLIPTRPEELPPREELRRKLGVEDRPLIFVALSGTLYEKLNICGLLIDFFRKHRGNYYVIMSQGLPGVHEFYEVDGFIKVYSWIRNRYEVLKAADLLICHGGHTTIAEAMYYGVPMIVIPTTGHTERMGNAKSAEELGIARIVPQEKLTYKTLKEALEDVLSNPEYRSKAMKVRELASQFHAQAMAAGIIEKLAMGAM